MHAGTLFFFWGMREGTSHPLNRTSTPACQALSLSFSLLLLLLGVRSNTSRSLGRSPSPARNGPGLWSTPGVRGCCKRSPEAKVGRIARSLPPRDYLERPVGLAAEAAVSAQAMRFS